MTEYLRRPEGPVTKPKVEEADAPSLVQPAASSSPETLAQRARPRRPVRLPTPPPLRVPLPGTLGNNGAMPELPEPGPLMADLNPSPLPDSATVSQAKPSEDGWTRDFQASSPAGEVQLHLTRTPAGELIGRYQLGQRGGPVSGMVLADGDVFLEGNDGSKWHGRYSEHNTLLFGNVSFPGAQLSGLELRAGPSPTTTTLDWAKLVLHETVNGHHLKITELKEADGQVQGSFFLEGIGYGQLTGTAHADSTGQRQLHWTATYASGEQAGRSRRLEGTLKVDAKGQPQLDGVWVFEDRAGQTQKYALQNWVAPKPSPASSWEQTLSAEHRAKLPALQEPKFLEELTAMCARMGVPRDLLLAVMSFESADVRRGTLGLDPQADNGLGYFGLIQFGDDAAEDMGLSVAQQFTKMTAIEQLPYVEKYLKQHGVPAAVAQARKAGRPLTLEELYMSILGGNARQASKPVWTSKAQNPTRYTNNAGLDSNHDDQISPTEAADAVRLHWRETFENNIDARSQHLERVWEMVKDARTGKRKRQWRAEYHDEVFSASLNSSPPQPGAKPAPEQKKPSANLETTTDTEQARIRRTRDWGASIGARSTPTITTAMASAMVNMSGIATIRTMMRVTITVLNGSAWSSSGATTTTF